jgi:hypothetical protein
VTRHYIRHQPIADGLRALPGQWGDVAEYPALYTALTTAAAIRTGRLPAYQPAGSFEADVFASRTPDGEPIVRARYLGAPGDKAALAAAEALRELTRKEGAA